MAAFLAPNEFGELDATEWFRQAAVRGGSLHGVIHQAVREALQTGGRDLELDSTDSPPAAPAADPWTHVGRSPIAVIPSTEPEPVAAPSGKPLSSDCVLAEVTAEMLDAGEMYQRTGSVWNAAILLGHPCLGFQVSLVLPLVLLLNIGFQVAFCIIVWKYMLEGNMNLGELLAFRLGVAHNVEYFDKVGQRSLARQVCDRDLKLHTSAMHTSFLKDYETFRGGGPVLMMLVLFLWMAEMLRELRQIVAQLDELGSMRRGPRTTVVLVGADPRDSLGRSSRTKDPAYLEKHMVTARLVQVTKFRVLAVYFGVVLPRCVVAIGLAVCGVMYLGRTDNMENLVLNAMALSFVLGIDEEFFETFLPRRVHTLVSNLEPAPLNGTRSARRFPAKESLVVFITIFAGLAAAVFLVEKPFVNQLDQSWNILCSGQLDFVFSENGATGMVHVARSAETAPLTLTKTERAVLQVTTQPVPQPGAAWTVDPSLALAPAGQPMAAFEPLSDSFDLLHFEGDSFEKVVDISQDTLEEAAGTLPCSDWAVAGRYPEVLGEIAGDSNITYCFEIDVELCGKMDSTRMRALCPMTCQCYSGVLLWSGPFATSAFGCPAGCLTSPTQFCDAVLSNVGFEGGAFPCEDTGTGNFSTITEYLPPNYQFFPTLAFRDVYRTYVSGLRECVTKDATMVEGVIDFLWYVDFWFPFYAWPDYDARVERIVGGGFFDELADGTWTVFPGVPTGCDYLASTEVTFLINVDLCAGGRIASIRPWCPRACGCSQGMAECPSACE